MHYTNMRPGIFLSRPNRFIAHVRIDGREEICHVKNTGRCRELLVPGVQVWCQESDNPNRKTRFDLISVVKNGHLINMDSQAPNATVRSWLQSGGLGELRELKPEYTHGDSRFDFSFLKDGHRCFLEVKGVTLEQDGHCAFPDAPTERGTKHLRGLTRAAGEGYGAYVLFVLQMAHALDVRPNVATDPAFAAALGEAKAAGVTLLAMNCTVAENAMVLRDAVPVLL